MVELEPTTIYFISSDSQEPGLEPEVSAKSLPDWYKTADRYDEAHSSTFRNCVPVFDSMTSGYVFLTPCDIEFTEVDNKLEIKVLDHNFVGFASAREPNPHFHNPEGYYDHHFAWLPRWGLSLGEGYSALYVTPLNRFELPFICASGIIDNDRMNTPGMMPFWIRKGFSGVIPKGTPFMQILPFKRENWQAINIAADELQVRRNLKRANRFRSEPNDYYRNHTWTRKKYRIKDGVRLTPEEGNQ